MRRRDPSCASGYRFFRPAKNVAVGLVQISRFIFSKYNQHMVSFPSPNAKMTGPIQMKCCIRVYE